MRRTLSGLSPADERARKVLLKIAEGRIVKVEYRQPRNLAWHNRYWALCQMVADNSEQYGSADEVSDHLKILAGHCTVVARVDTGELDRLPKSISFSAMDQGQFEDFWRRAVKAVCENILPGVTEAAVEDELLNLIGAANWHA